MALLAQSDEDFAFALYLQENDDSSNIKKTGRSKNSSCSIVDSDMELIDPTPDIYALFREFDRTYFWGKLDCCTLQWSPQMTLCAGVCKYEGRSGLCSIHLSSPLLKLRPRKDLVETLLHEMIHAYLFVTHNNKDHNAHGPEFVKHMKRINEHSGTNITICHSFHDEVDLYRQHWWQCNGICRNKAPYFGLLKRAKNRQPGPNDSWWKDHQTFCGGTYIKIKSPEPKQAVKRKRNDETKSDSKKKTGQYALFSGKGNRLGSATSKEPQNTLTNFIEIDAVKRENNTSKTINYPDTTPSKRLRQDRLDNFIKASSSNSREVPKNVSSLHNKTAQSTSKMCDIIVDAELVICPACQTQCEKSKINDHLDRCLL
ncbi:hypothetical protein CHUAL_012264 [Chamberlinius hualienensis]